MRRFRRMTFSDNVLMKFSTEKTIGQLIDNTEM